MAEAAHNSDPTYDVFIGHVVEDKAFAVKLRKELEANGTSCIGSDDVHDPYIEGSDDSRRLISQATFFLFIVSPDAVNSRSLIADLEWTVEVKMPIISILHIPTPTPWPLSTEIVRSEINFTNESDFEESFAELLKLLAPPSMASKGGDTISLVAPGSTSAEEFPATPALARLLAKATAISQAYEKDFDLSFSSMLLAFLAAHDPLSQWFAHYVRDAGIAIDEMLKARGLGRAIFDAIAARPLDEMELATLNLPRRRTESAKNLMHAAHKINADFNLLADRDPETLLDVRHLMAAYIYRPAGHEKDLEGLRFDRSAWSNTFLGQIKKLYPEELAWWKVLHRDTFGTEPIPVEEIEGPSTHIASDMWTTEDTLGYGAYAHAIYRFMTHKQTRSPLTISIQAPWGGGKTSLMRMIQRKLDPAAFAEVKSEGKQLRGELTIGDALKEIDKWITSKTQEALPSIETGKNSEMLTVWFNAWKYENVNQVWAGLVDAVMQQIAARLPLIEREKFWLQLNLKRVDADKLRHRIHERIFRYFWRGVRYWLTAIGGAVLTSILLALTVWLSTSDALLSRWTGISFSVVASGLAAIWKFRNAKSEVEKEPAAVSLSEYLDIPNYSAEMGFIHHVEADLRRVLASVPTQYRPIVIFVDDLDRCSPAKVAQVVEAVNLFLAGDFPNCMFIMGMDTEMVAAALQAAHKEMIACLPSDAGIPVGWRFMDKFVQLPFLIRSCFTIDAEHCADEYKA